MFDTLFRAIDQLEKNDKNNIAENYQKFRENFKQYESNIPKQTDERSNQANFGMPYREENK